MTKVATYAILNKAKLLGPELKDFIKSVPEAIESNWPCSLSFTADDGKNIRARFIISPRADAIVLDVPLVMFNSLPTMEEVLKDE